MPILDLEYNSGIEAAARDLEAEAQAIYGMGLEYDDEGKIWRDRAELLKRAATRVRTLKVSV